MEEPRDPSRRAAQYRVDRLVAEDVPPVPGDGSARSSPGASLVPAAPADGSDGAPGGPRPSTMAARASYADELVRQAMARGEFDHLPLAGKPIPGLTGRHDPDWWLKAFIEREGITGVLPEALQLRKDDVVLDDLLDREHTEARVREVIGEFNARVVQARRQLLGGPPVVTPTRDVEREVVRWHERRRVRRAEGEAREERARLQNRAASRRRVPWWRRDVHRPTTER